MQEEFWSNTVPLRRHYLGQNCSVAIFMYALLLYLPQAIRHLLAALPLALCCGLVILLLSQAASLIPFSQAWLEEWLFILANVKSALRAYSPPTLIFILG